MRRRTRIVVTLGPATDRPGVLESLLSAGLDVARLNFSHGVAEDHRARVARLRQAAAARGRSVTVLADLPGPKLRTLLRTPRTLLVGQEVVFAEDLSNPENIGITEPEAIRDVRPGHRLLLDDGRLQLTAVRVEVGRLIARVEDGGELLPNKGINLPDTPLSIPAVTDRDREALSIAASLGADWLALSFVRGPEAADELRAAARACGLEVPILAKMERPEAVANAAKIINAFDGIMVARGDLGVEIPLERVPLVQKQLISEARAAGKPVITATDMLDSMRDNPRPTRAEASDVANAIFDGTDAVMLSGETAIGHYPLEAVKAMDRIACVTEEQLAEGRGPDLIPALHIASPSIADQITTATGELARSVGADAIVTPTVSGRTARLIARHRLRADVIAPAPSEAVIRRLGLVWGVQAVPLQGDLQRGADRLEAAIRAAFAHGALTVGQLCVVLAGHPIEGGGRSPTIRVVRVGADGRPEAP